MESVSEKTWRLFVAVDMPPEVVDLAVAIQKQLKKEELFSGTYTHLEGMHVTLKFLGDVIQSDVAKVQDELKKVVATPFLARVGAVDVFASGSHIKVIYLHIICPELAKLVEQIETVVEPFSPRETRPFIGHLTLARVKKVENSRKLLDVINRIEIPKITFEINEFILKRSQLSSIGPTYTDVAKYSFE